MAQVRTREAGSGISPKRQAVCVSAAGAVAIAVTLLALLLFGVAGIPFVHPLNLQWGRHGFSAWVDPPTSRLQTGSPSRPVSYHNSSFDDVIVNPGTVRTILLTSSYKGPRPTALLIDGGFPTDWRVYGFRVGKRRYFLTWW